MNRRLAKTALWIPCAAILWTFLSSDLPIAIAQPDGVSHEIKSWNIDGTVTASVTFGLPDGFTNRVRPATATVTCDAQPNCRAFDFTVTGNAQTGLIGDLGVQLAPGETALSIEVVAAQTSSGDALEHGVENYSISVPRVRPPTVTYEGHEIQTHHADGTADVLLRLFVERGDRWPMPAFQIEAWCIAVDPCSAQETVFPGWVTDSRAADIHFVPLLVKRMAQGNHRLLVRVRDYAPPGFIDPWTGDHRQVAVYGIGFNVPRALPPEIHLDRYDLVGYSEDATANIELTFVVKRPDAWPMSSIRARLGCSQYQTCLVDEVVTPDWVRDDNLDSFLWQLTVSGIAIGSIQLDGAFEAEHHPWFGAPRTTTIADINLEVPEQKEFQVVWRPVTSQVNGYYMDGTASVDLSVVGWQIGRAESVADRISGVCYSETSGEEPVCHDLIDALDISISKEKETFEMRQLRLPQGTTPISVKAGIATGELEIHVQERFIGISRELWECFIDTSPKHGATCGGFHTPYLERWALNTVNVYRVGVEPYIRIFDEFIATVGELTGIDFVNTDDPEKAHVEAYLGHEGHERVLSKQGASCSYHHATCTSRWMSLQNGHIVDRVLISIRKRNPEWRDASISIEDAIAYITIREGLGALIPTSDDDRPHSPGLVDQSTLMRRHDMQMFRLLYSPFAQPGMMLADLREYVVLNEETLNYQAGLPEPELFARNVWRTLFEAGSISLEMMGSDVRGRALDSGPLINVNYAGFAPDHSLLTKFETASWSSIIIGWDEESWSSAGGRWTQSESHEGRGRDYRSRVNFDFPLADPMTIVRRAVFNADRIELSERGDDLIVMKAAYERDIWPKPEVEMVVDRESYEMRFYVVQWHFDADNRARLPYRLEAKVIEYGAEFEIPDEVLEKSEYLANLDW